MDSLQNTWVYLSASPLFHLTLTLVAFHVASALFEKMGRNPLLNPVLGAVLIVVAVLVLTGTEYGTYFEGAQFVHFLLGPATVALAVPLYRQWHRVRRSALAIAVSLLAGSLTAVLVIVTGILGAMLGPKVLDVAGVVDWRARGLAIGTASHGIGTARALQVNETAGAFSGLAMGLNALATALLLPLIWGGVVWLMGG